MITHPYLTPILVGLAILAASTGKLHAGPPSPPVEQMEKPALDVLDASVAVVSSARMPLPNGGAIQQSVLETSFDFTRRFGLGGAWYLALGASYESFVFGRATNGLPDQLQGIAGILALQYVVQDHVAMTLELRPGFYAGGKINSDALDVPVTAYAPIPLRSDLFLLIGGRVSGLQNPPVVPIGGLIWLIQKDLRLEAIFPQSHLVYSPNDFWEYHLVAEIVGDGYRVDRDPSLPAQLRGAALQYSESRAGAGVNYTLRKGAMVGLDAGYVFERSLDFFRARTDFRSGGSVYLRLQGSLEF